MRYLKIICKFSCIVMMCHSCLSSSQENDKNTSTKELPTVSSEKESGKRLKYFNITDTRNGMVIERYPFPEKWEQHTGAEFAYTGPNGIRVYSEKGMNYAYSTDPTILQQYEYVGMQVKYPLNVDQVINDVMVPYASQLNRKMTKRYPLSQIRQFDQNLDNMLFKVEQNQKHLAAEAIEWVDHDGTRWLTVLHYILEQNYNNVFWSYRASAICAAPAHFEQAKLDYLNGLLNRQINTVWINAMNQQNEYTIRKNEEAHAKREAEFKRGVEQRQRQWEASQETAARRQEHISDVLLGKTNIVEPDTGIRSKIDHTSKYYWVNSDGKYVGTDDYKYDPNKDDFINNRTWKEYNLDDYR